MRSLLFPTIVLALLLVLAPPAHGADGPSPDNPCSCTFFTPASGDEPIVAIVVLLEAQTEVTMADKYFLKLVDKQGKTIHYIRLTIGEDGKGKVVTRFDEPFPANKPFMAVLFSPKKNIAMTDLKVFGKYKGGEVTYFDHGCTGITIGPAGCIHMELW